MWCFVCVSFAYVFACLLGRLFVSLVNLKDEFVCVFCMWGGWLVGRLVGSLFVFSWLVACLVG